MGGLSTPGTLLCMHPHDFKHLPDHSPLSLSVLCSIIHEEPFLLPIWIRISNNPQSKYPWLNSFLNWLNFSLIILDATHHRKEFQPPIPDSTDSTNIFMCYFKSIFTSYYIHIIFVWFHIILYSIDMYFSAQYFLSEHDCLIIF